MILPGDRVVRAHRCLSFQKDLLTNCLLFLGVCFLTWSWDVPQMRHVAHTIGVAVVGHSKLSQNGASGCLTVFLLCQSLRISRGHEVQVPEHIKKPSLVKMEGSVCGR